MGTYLHKPVESILYKADINTINNSPSLAHASNQRHSLLPKRHLKSNSDTSLM